MGLAGVIAGGFWLSSVGRLPQISNWFAATVPTGTPTPTPAHAPASSPTRTPNRAPTLSLLATRQARELHATATAQAAWVDGFAAPILAEISGRPPNFQDDFETMSGRYVRWSSLTHGVTFADGSLKMSVIDGYVDAAGSLVATNFVLEFSLTPRTISSESWIGANFRCSDNISYNYGVIPSQDWWGMGITEPDADWRGLLEGSTDQVEPDRQARITIIAQGDRFAFYLNGRPLGHIRDSTLQGAWISIGVYSPSGAAQVDLDNVKLWDLNNLLP
jgi:hypothetical protein